MSAQESFDDSFWENEQRAWDEAREHVEQRALTEQTKGMLMFVYGIDAEEAFEILRKQSQDNNIKLRLIAEQIRKDLIELSRTNGPARRLAFDGLAHAAHRRVAHAAARQLDGQRKTSVSMDDPGARPQQD